MERNECDNKAEKEQARERDRESKYDENKNIK